MTALCRFDDEAVTAVARRLLSVSRLRRHLARDLGTPFFHRLETGPGAAEGFGLAQDVRFRAIEVERFADGLGHVPGAVGEDFDAVPLGIAEIDGPGVAVAHG